MLYFIICLLLLKVDNQLNNKNKYNNQINIIT